VSGLRFAVLIAIGLISLLVLALVAYRMLTGTEAPPVEEGAPSTPQPIVLRIGLLPVIDSIPFIVADVEGLYAKYGFNATLTFFGSARDRDAAFTAGLIDVALNDPITTLMLADRGVDVRILSLLLGEHPSDGLFYLLAPPGSGVDVRSLKQVAVSRNTIIEFVTWVMLERLGVDPRGVELIDVPSIPLRFQMLMEGRVEAAVLPDPWGSLALAKGARLLARDDMFGEPITMSAIIARPAVIGDREVVLRLVSMLNEALELYKANPEKYRGVIEEKIFIPEELRGKWLPEWRGRITVYPRGNFELVSSWLLLRGLITNKPDYNALVVQWG
jgi:NitT/TauT family transport system substrate-binding protein